MRVQYIPFKCLILRLQTSVEVETGIAGGGFPAMSVSAGEDEFFGDRKVDCISLGQSQFREIPGEQGIFDLSRRSGQPTFKSENKLGRRQR